MSSISLKLRLIHNGMQKYFYFCPTFDINPKWNIQSCKKVTALQLKKKNGHQRFYGSKVIRMHLTWGSLLSLNRTWLSSGKKSLEGDYSCVVPKIRQESEPWEKTQYMKLLSDRLTFLELTNTYNFKSTLWTKSSNHFSVNFFVLVIPQSHIYIFFKNL